MVTNSSRFLWLSLLGAVVACGGSTDLFSNTSATGGEGGTASSGDGGTTSGSGGTSSGTGGSSSGTGGAGGCSSPDDCPAPGADCLDPTCVAGQCGTTNSPPGTPCGADGACDGAGTCLSANGTSCTDGSHCASGHCVDDVCCDTACNGLCLACDAPGSLGTCGPQVPGTDPDGECGGGVCDGSGGCAEGNLLWGKRFGNSATQYAFRVAVDGAGNSAMTGYFAGSVDFGGGALTSAGGYDIYVVKLDPAGNHIWSKRFGDSSNQYGQYGWGVALDSGGNTILTGYYYGTIDFGSGPHTVTGGRDIFLAKFSPNGTLLWDHVFPGSNSTDSDEWCRAITVDGNDNITIGGWFENSVDFGGGWLTSVNDWDIFVAKFNSAGVYQHSARYGGNDDQQIYAMTTDSANNLLVTGYFRGTVDFGSGTGQLTSAGDRDVLIAKFNPAGTALWSQSYGTTAEQRGRSIATDPEDNVIVGGYFEDDVDFGGGTVQNNGGFDALLLKYDGSGNHLWSKAVGSGTNQLSEGLAVDGSGNIILAGQTVGGMDFGGGMVGTPNTNSTEAFLLKVSTSGDHLWSKVFDGSFAQSSQAAGTDGAGNAYVAGYFQSSINLGGGQLNSMGNYDIFLGKFEP